MSWNRNMRTESGIFRDTEKESRSYGSFSVYCQGFTAAAVVVLTAGCGII